MPEWRATGDTELPVAPDETAWDAAEAARRVFTWAGFETDNPDSERAARAFFAQDAEAPELRGSYKLGFADIIDGVLTAVPRGIFAVAGGRGVNQADLPEDVKTQIKSRVRRYYERMERETPESIKSIEDASPSHRTPQIEYKRFPSFVKNINGRVVTGVFAVHGNVDDGGDMSVNGSFAKRLQNGRRRIRFLWNHNSQNPPIATILDVREIDRSELPPRVLDYAPDATGGVQVTREYYENNPLASWVLEAIRKGDIDEMSYAFDVHKFDVQERDGKRVRVLQDVEIFDISDVNWGLNPATAGVKSAFPEAGMTFVDHSEWVVSTVRGYLARAEERAAFRAKEGRVLSAANRERIGNLVNLLAEVQADLQDLLDATAPRANPDDVQKQYARFQAIVARLNGVPIGV